MTTTSPAELSTLLAAATRAARDLATRPPAFLRAALHAVADAVEGAAEDLVPVARRESHLPEARLRGELGRTVFQLRLLGDAAATGDQLDLTLDTADPDWPAGGRPDLRRMSRPVGPVVVFGASNFPFAFSVAGGDTAAALAAGCPVLHKAHPGHPETAALVGGLVARALRAAGAPEGAFALLHGDEAGRAAVTAPEVKAGAFTGSPEGGRALSRLAAGRPDPIPFYAEMGSVNPVVLTPAAAAARLDAVAEGFVGSYLLGAGQFCTKPGVLFVPAAVAERFAAAVVARVADRPATRLLNDRVAEGHRARRDELSGHAAVEVLVAGCDGPDGTRPALLSTTAADVLRAPGELLVECFGPTALLVSYADTGELLSALDLFAGELTATVHGEPDDPDAPVLLARVAEFAGRVLWNGWPTGVAVTHAQHHGGPSPAATGVFTSVGTGSIRRFLRPVAYQGVPAALLPEALREDSPLRTARRVDGVLEVADRG